MKFFKKVKDGGSESPVDAYFLVEIKGWFSIALLKFNKGGRENFHTHAFNALTWFIRGDLVEQDVHGGLYTYRRTLFPKVTKRDKNHRVRAYEDSWCLTLRGSWCRFWTEYDRAVEGESWCKSCGTLSPHVPREHHPECNPYLDADNFPEYENPLGTCPECSSDYLSIDSSREMQWSVISCGDCGYSFGDKLDEETLTEKFLAIGR